MIHRGTEFVVQSMVRALSEGAKDKSQGSVFKTKGMSIIHIYVHSTLTWRS